MPWVFGLVLKWYDKSESSPLGFASVIPWPDGIQSWIVNFRAEVRAKARNKRKGRKILTPSGRQKNVFSWKQLGLVQGETFVVFLHTRATGDTVRRTWNEVEIRQKFSSRSKHPLRYRKWMTQTDGKSLNSPKANPTTKAENSLSTVGKMKNIVAWLSTLSRVSWLQVWKQMHSLLSLLKSTSWWWEEQPQREVEKKVLRDKLLSWKKKSKVVYLKTQRQRILFYGKPENWDWTLRRDTFEIFRMHLVQLEFGKEGQSGGSIRKGDPHEQNPCAPGVEEQPPEETSWQAGCTSKVAWKLATKYASLSRTWNNVLFSCEGARDTEDRLFIVYSGASVHNAEQGELSTHTMDTLRRSKTPYATYRD